MSPAHQGTDSPRVIAFPPALFGGTFLVTVLLNWLMPRPITHGMAVRIVGGALMVGAVMLAGWGRQMMVRAGTNVDPREPTTAIVTEGPFRYSRNPFYIALSTFYLGGALLINSVWPLILLIPLLLVTQFGIVRREERYLEAKFGETYLAYKRRVRRWL